MAGAQRVYKQRINSTRTLKKVFRAMELIAASRIGAARDAAQSSGPYNAALSRAVAAVASYSGLDHPITRERTDTNRVAVPSCVKVNDSSSTWLKRAKSR